jgi:hypothetical protein
VLMKLTQGRGQVALVALGVILPGLVTALFVILAILAKGDARETPSEVAIGAGTTFLAGLISWLTAALASRAQRRNAYAGFLTSADSLVKADACRLEAQAACDAASREFDAAQRKYGRFGNEQNGAAAIAANRRRTDAKQRLNFAETAVEGRQGEYDSAAQRVAELVRESVRPAFEAFRACAPQDTTARTLVRSAYVKAARRDVLIRDRDDESTL